MRQVFLPKGWIDTEKKQAILVDDPFHHVVHVLRKQKGDAVEAFDGQGAIYRARIVEITSERAVLEILETRRADAAGRFALTLGAGILKGKKMNWLVQKVTEVGVHTIVPLITRRTIARPGENGPDKAAKWEKVAVEAAKQCGAAHVPNIHHPVKLEDFLRESGNFDAKLLAWEGKDAAPLRVWAGKAMPGLANVGRPVSALLLVGPEGGFDPKEVALAQQQGFALFGLGGNILRSETAAIVASALMLYELENA